MDAQFVHVWIVREGRVTRFQQYTDTAQFARVAEEPSAPVAAPTAAGMFDTRAAATSASAS